jgi:hypothetical protein
MHSTHFSDSDEETEMVASSKLSRRSSSSITTQCKESLPIDNFQDVETTLDWLTKIAIAIRRDGTRYRDLRAEQFAEKDTSDLGEATRQSLKSLQMAGQFKSARCTSPSLMQECQDSADLHVRLAECNERRRRRFYYVLARDKRLGSHVPTARPQVPTTKIYDAPQELDQPSQPAPNSSEPEPMSGGAIIAPPTTTNLSKSSSAATPLDRDAYKPPTQSEDALNFSTLLREEGSFVTSRFKMHYPPPPKVASNALYFKCDLCCQLLPREEAAKDRWRLVDHLFYLTQLYLTRVANYHMFRKHVKEDLRPYVCLMSNCSKPFETFNNTKDWLRHMKKEFQENIVRWICKAAKHKSETFYSEGDFERHMREQHSKAFTESQLPVLIKRSGAPAAKMFTRCPLCSWFPEDKSRDKNYSTSAQDLFETNPSSEPETEEARELREVVERIELERHIAAHLQYIALMSLPEEVLSSSKDSIKSTSSSSSSSAVSDESDQNVTQSDIDYLQNPANVSEEEIALGFNSVDETALVPEWNRVYYKLAEKNELPLRCLSFHHIAIDLQYLTVIVFCSHVEKAFVDRQALFRSLLNKLRQTRSDNLIECRKVVLVGPEGVG